MNSNISYYDDDVFSFLDSREVAKERWRLLAPFTYNDSVEGLITVHEGFETDYASVYSFRSFFLFPIYSLMADYGDRSATIHDFLYWGGSITNEKSNQKYLSRKEADQVFYRALRKDGIANWRAYLFYYGVRLGGKKRFKGKGNND